MIYVFLAEGFEEIEAVTPIDTLRRCGLDVCTVGVTGKVVTGSHGIPVTCDKVIDEVSEDGIEALVLPGGMPGTKNLAACEKLTKLIVRCHNKGVLIGAICAAPTVLGGLGLLSGREAVCYPGMESGLGGAKSSDKPCVKDGNIITSRGAGTALDFSYALITALKGGAAAEELAHNIVWKR